MVLLHAVAIVERRAINELRPWLALFRGALQPAKSLRLIAVLKEQEPKCRLSVQVPRRGRFFEPQLRSSQVERNPASEPVGLPQIECRVGVAARGQRPPDGDGSAIVGLLPRLDARLHALSGNRSAQQSRRDGDN